MPVYAGAAESPRSSFKANLRKVQLWNEIIREEKDPEARKELAKERDKASAEMMKAYKRLSPEDVDEMTSLLRPKT